LKRKGEDFHLGPWQIGWEPGRRARYFDVYFLSRDDSCRIIQPVQDSLADIFDNAFKLDKLAVTTEIGAALITGVGGKERAICSNDLIGEEPQALSDFYQDMEDMIVEIFP
jgi:hypothetical protein